MTVLPFISLVDVKEYLHWLTDVIQTHRGEQRICLREVPRQELEYEHILDSQQYALAKNLISASLTELVGVPLWTEHTRVDITNGASEVAIDTTAATYSKYAYIYCKDAQAIVELTTVGDSVLRFAAPVDADYRDALICPLREGRITEHGFERLQNDIIKLSVTYLITDTADIAVDNLPKYQGFGVWEQCGLNGVSERIDRPVDVVDNGISYQSPIATTTYTAHVQQLKMLLEGGQDLFKVRKWLHYLKGRQKPFWLPTWSNDYQPVSDINASDTDIVVKNVGLSKVAGVRHAMIKTKGGSHFVKILQAVGSGSTETITLSQPVRVGIALADIDCFCSLSLVRLSQDAVEIEHIEKQRARIGLALREVSDADLV